MHDPAPAHYEIRVNGVLDSRWSAWFDGLQLTSDQSGQTSITGPVTDQAALHGLLAKVRDLGLELLEMGRSDPTTDMEVTRCSSHRSHRARRQPRSVGSCGSPGGSSGAGHPARSTGAPPPGGSCPPDTTHVINRPDLPRRPART
jgi:hypothetical protein